MSGPVRTDAQVLAAVHCPHCCEPVQRRIRYRAPPPGKARVVADGQADSPCPRCAFEGGWPVEVWIARDRVVEVTNPSRRLDWVNAALPFIVLEE